MFAVGQGAWQRSGAGTDYLWRRHRGFGQEALMVGGLEILLDLHLIPMAIKGFGTGTDGT